MFSWRLALALGDARYSDLVERTLFNVVATSPSKSGTAFYYANTLHQRTPGTPAADDTVSPRAESSLRAPWFEVSCCPPNVARTLASLDAFIATADDEGLQLHQYAAGSIRTRLAGGQEVSLDIETDYPRTGTIRITTPIAGDFTLSLRIPQWADVAELRVRSGGEVVSSQVVQPGWAAVRRSFHAGDCVELDLPIEPRVVYPDRRIDSVRGCVAVERGPEVFCLESVDLAAAGDGTADDVADVRLDPSAPVIVKEGVPFVRLLVVRDDDPDHGWPYSAAEPESRPSGALEVPLIPYHDWAERGPSTMRVWLPIE
jgi:DUF1680 family protein